MLLEPNCVFCTKIPVASYDFCPDVRFPELPAWAKMTTALVALRALFAQDKTNPVCAVGACLFQLSATYRYTTS